MTHDEKNKSDYYDWEPEERMEQETPEWKVYYSCNFNGYHGRERAGKEISVAKQFCWGDEVWHIPAVYSCTAGLVVDFCIEINPERIKSFFDKYYLSHEDDYFFTDEEREQINAENPLNFDFRSQIVLNGKTLHQRHSCSTTWIPEFCLPQSIESDLTSKWIIGHYGLDPSKGWIFHRATFPWATKKRPTMRLLRLNLEQEPVDISRIYFDNLDISKSIAFSHPITDTEHTLTVMAYEKQEIDRQHFCGENLEFPTHYTKMTYVLSPEIPNQSFLISDCEKGDRPR
ncbi:MAG TPA: hypothetical protein VJZ06_01245, partial [Mobilitalea sp.]|nr:hypothetical protein [Mobilitalea sp.]